MGGSVWGSIRRLFHPGAKVRREMGLPWDGEGWGGMQRLQSEPVCLWDDGTEGAAAQPLLWQARVLPSHREMQLPAVLCRWQRWAGLHRVPARDLSLWQRQVSVCVLSVSVSLRYFHTENLIISLARRGQLSCSQIFSAVDSENSSKQNISPRGPFSSFSGDFDHIKSLVSAGCVCCCHGALVQTFGLEAISPLGWLKADVQSLFMTLKTGFDKTASVQGPFSSCSATVCLFLYFLSNGLCLHCGQVS